MNGGEIIARILKEHEVRYVFTLCGGHISPILTECRKAGIRIIDVRHEATAVFAADAVSRITGVPGVAVVTAGPGVSNTLTALINAAQAQSPLIIFGGAAATVLRGRGSLQDIDQQSLVRSAVKAVYTVKRNCDFIPIVEFAFSFALSGVPGPIFIECPIDLLYDEALVRHWYGFKSSTGSNSVRQRVISWYLKRHLDRLYTCDLDSMEHERIPIEKPDITKRSLVKFSRIVKESKRPVMIVGSQALCNPRRATELAAAISSIGIPVFLTGMARGLLGNGHHLQYRHHRNEALAGADLVVLAGMPCDFRLNYGRSINEKTFTVGINRSRRDLTLNQTPLLAVHADPADFIVAAASFIGGHHPDEKWNIDLRSREEKRIEEILTMSEKKVDPVNPLALLRKIDELIGTTSTVVADGGDFVSTAAYLLNPRRPLSWLDPGVFGTLGVGAGFALGAKLCRPGDDVWLIWGDGAAGYGLMEFDTFVRHGVNVLAVIGNDAGWTQIARDQVEYLHDDVATVLRYSDYERAAEGLGARGFRIDSEASIQVILSRALDASRSGAPVLVNARIGKSEFRKGAVSM